MDGRFFVSENDEQSVLPPPSSLDTVVGHHDSLVEAGLKNRKTPFMVTELKTDTLNWIYKTKHLIPHFHAPFSPSIPYYTPTSLIRTLERRDRLALRRVQGGVLDLAVLQVDLAVRLLLPCESVLHPVLVVTLGVVLAGVGTARLLAVGGRDSRLGSIRR